MKKTVSIHRLGVAFIVLLAVTIAAQFGLDWAVWAFAPEIAEMAWYPWALSILPLYLCALPLCLLILRSGRGEEEEMPQPRPLSIPRWLLALVFTLGFMYIGNLIGNFLMTLVSLLRGETSANPISEMILGANPLWTVLCTVIIAPIGEEFLFRRLIIDHTRRFGELPAILLSAAMFGAFHMNFYQFFYAFLVGIVFGYVYAKTGRLRYTVALHAVINFLGGVLAPLLLNAVNSVLESVEDPEAITELSELLPLLAVVLVFLLYIAVLLGCTVASVVVAIVCHRRISLAPGEGSRPVFTSPAVIVFFVLCAIMMVWSMF